MFGRAAAASAPAASSGFSFGGGAASAPAGFSFGGRAAPAATAITGLGGAAPTIGFGAAASTECAAPAAIASDPNMGFGATAVTPAAPASGSGAASTGVRKTKFEANNSYIQYVMERKRLLLSIDPKGVLDNKKVGVDWQNLSSEERKVYEERYKAEKERLGDDFRKGRKPREKKEKKEKTKSLKKSVSHAPVSNTLVQESDPNIFIDTPSKTISIPELLDKLESLDNSFDEASEQNERIEKELFSARVQLEVKKQILHNKAASSDAFNSKYLDLQKQHESCYKV